MELLLLVNMLKAGQSFSLTLSELIWHLVQNLRLLGLVLKGSNGRKLSRELSLLRVLMLVFKRGELLLFNLRPAI